jgi:hypothetical protein
MATTSSNVFMVPLFFITTPMKIIMGIYPHVQSDLQAE